MLCLLKFWFQTDLADAKIQPAITGRENSCFSCSRAGHALRSICILWLVKICQVGSCEKFMQHLETTGGPNSVGVIRKIPFFLQK